MGCEETCQIWKGFKSYKYLTSITAKSEIYSIRRLNYESFLTYTTRLTYINHPHRTPYKNIAPNWDNKKGVFPYTVIDMYIRLRNIYIHIDWFRIGNEVNKALSKLLILCCISLFG